MEVIPVCTTSRARAAEIGTGEVFEYECQVWLKATNGSHGAQRAVRLRDGALRAISGSAWVTPTDYVVCHRSRVKDA